MKRTIITPRQNWSAQVEALGLSFYKTGSLPYWDESVCYEFTAAEIDMFEAAANDVHKMCLQAIDHIISNKLFPFLGISPDVGALITESWSRNDPYVYGRFDFLYDGTNPPKLLEYNADTPSALFEASIVQWNWREQVFPKADQFNSIHEHLTNRWQNMLIGRWLDDGRGNNIANQLYVTTAAPSPEDEQTVQYMGQTAIEAGFTVQYIPIQNIGWQAEGNYYTSTDETPIRQLFKLYPWEWLLRDQPDNIKLTLKSQLWVEPLWKLLWSNKGLLPILWDLFPEHPNLLAAYRDPGKFGNSRYVAKPMLGREGQNITIREGSKILEKTGGTYDDDTFIYQAFGEGAHFDGNRPNLGIWMVGDEACGMGIREDKKLVVSNGSRFIPHIFT